MDLSVITLPLVEISVTKIDLDKETLIRERSKLFKSCGATELLLYHLLLYNTFTVDLDRMEI
jgi:hypothetical protein